MRTTQRQINWIPAFSAFVSFSSSPSPAPFFPSLAVLLLQSNLSTNPAFADKASELETFPTPQFNFAGSDGTLNGAIVRGDGGGKDDE